MTRNVISEIAFILRGGKTGKLRLMSSWQNMAMVSVFLFLTVQKLQRLNLANIDPSYFILHIMFESWSRNMFLEIALNHETVYSHENVLYTLIRLGHITSPSVTWDCRGNTFNMRTWQQSMTLITHLSCAECKLCLVDSRERSWSQALLVEDFPS